jgi:hypothetical protein
MLFDKDLGFADRYVILSLPTHKITKLVYKGRSSHLGIEYLVRHYDADGYVITEKHIWNTKVKGTKQFYFTVQ